LNARAPPRLKKFIQLVGKNIRMKLIDLIVTNKIYATSDIPLLLIKRQIYEMLYATHFGCMIGYHSQVYEKKINVVKSRVNESLDF
jgi:hypothetical protein